MSGFFEKIANIINGTPSETVPEVESKSNQCTNSIDKKGALQSAVIKVLKSNYKGSGATLADYTLILSVDDNLFYTSLVSDNFLGELKVSIADELGIAFKSVVIVEGSGSESGRTEVMEHCYLQIHKEEVEQNVARAKIFCLEDNGSLIDGPVVLDAQMMAQLPGQRCNIGVGKNPAMANGVYRVNQIAIDDDPSSPQYDKNRYVSRAHAHISYSDELGFVLYVDQGGTRAAQKRTHVHRGGEVIELNNTIIPVSLRDGDCIVLSKKVYMLFKTV